MVDFRKHESAIRELVAQFNQNAPRWIWDVRSLKQGAVEVYWEKLWQLKDGRKPFFMLEAMEFADNRTDILVIDEWGNTIGIWSLPDPYGFSEEKNIQMALWQLFSRSRLYYN